MTESGWVTIDNTIETLYNECVSCFDENEVFTEGVGEALKKGMSKLKELIQKIIDKVREILGKTPKKPDEVEINPNVEVDKKELTKIQKIRAMLEKIIKAPAKLLCDAYKNHKGALYAVIAGVLAFGGVRLIRAKQNEEIHKRNEPKVNKRNIIWEDIKLLEKELIDYEKWCTKWNQAYDKEYGKKINDQMLERWDQLNSIELENDLTYAKTLQLIYTKIAAVVNKIISGLGTALNSLTRPKKK